MADDKKFFPGFEGDDEPKKPAKPAASAKPAFDPFAGAQVKVPGPAELATAPPPLSPPPPPADADAELKPGSRKDLWKCPHCGAGNKPGREECRTCGKKPSDPVIVPWHRQPAILAAIGAGAVLLIVLLVMLGRADLSLHAPGAGFIDRKPRIGGSASGNYEITSTVKLITDRQISVSGRVVAVRPGKGAIQIIALALGKAAMDGKFEDLKATPSDEGGFSFSDGKVLFCLFAGKPELKPGQWLSLVGETGDLIEDSRKMRHAEGAIAVKVDKFNVE